MNVDRGAMISLLLTAPFTVAEPQKTAIGEFRTDRLFLFLLREHSDDTLLLVDGSIQ